jgi:hypothetical protein
MDGSVGVPFLYFSNLESVDYRISKLYMGEEVEVGEMIPQRMVKNLLEPYQEQGQRKKTSARKNTRGNGDKRGSTKPYND